MSAEDLIRAALLLELVLILGCGLGWHLAHRHAIPAAAWRIGWAFGYVIGAVAVGVTLNAVADEPLTLGSRVLTAALAPAAAAIAVLTTRAIRR